MARSCVRLLEGGRARRRGWCLFRAFLAACLLACAAPASLLASPPALPPAAPAAASSASPSALPDSASTRATPSSTHKVVIEAVAFAPAELRVRRGDTVVWTNRDPFPHTATAAGHFDSGPIEAGASWRLQMTTPGSFDYVCTLHPTMHGRLVVQ